MEFVIIITFVIGYLAIALEQLVKINKTACALVTKGSGIGVPGNA